VIEEESNRAADLLIGWLQNEFESEPWFVDLRTKIDGDLRHDLKNFALYVRMAASMKGNEAAEITWGFLALQYLVEKGYADPRDLPRYLRIANELDTAVLGDAVPYAVVHALLPDSIPADHALAELLATPKLALESFQSWYREHALVEPEEDPGEDIQPRIPLTPFDDYALHLVQWDFFSAANRLEMELETRIEPFLTNGEWDETTGRVRWPEERIESYRIPATYRVALWVVSNEAARESYLGNVILSDEELWEYALWRHGLTDKEEAQWTEVLRVLASDPEADEHFDGLSFIGEVDPRLEGKARALLGCE